METLIITKKDLIHKDIFTNGYIFVKAGSGIEAGSMTYRMQICSECRECFATDEDIQNCIGASAPLYEGDPGC